MLLPPSFFQAVIALRDARERCFGADAPVHASTFVLWATALDEAIEKLNRGVYRSAKEPPSGIRRLVPHHLFEAFKIARNAIAHGSVVAVRPGGLAFPIQFPITFTLVTWVEVSDIPRWPGQKPPSADALRAYATLLAGQRVEFALDTALAWFESLTPDQLRASPPLCPIDLSAMRAIDSAYGSERWICPTCGIAVL